MEYPFAKVGLHRLALGKAGQLKDTAIHVNYSSVRSQHDDIVPDGIDNLPQVGFGVLDSFERHPECRLRLLALDGYRCDAARISNQSNIVGGRLANFPVVHAEGSQHPAIVREYGTGPCGAQSNWSCSCPEFYPERIGKNVLNKHGLAAIDSGA